MPYVPSLTYVSHISSYQSCCFCFCFYPLRTENIATLAADTVSHHQDSVVTLPSVVPLPASYSPTSVSSTIAITCNNSTLSLPTVSSTAATLGMITQVTPAHPAVFSLQSRILAVHNNTNIDLDSSASSPRPVEDVSPLSALSSEDVTGDRITTKSTSSTASAPLIGVPVKFPLASR